MRYVIIGNSAAGISAVEAIRTVDSKGEIVVISSDTQTAYSPALTTYYMSKKIDEKNIYLKEKDFYLKNKIKLKLGITAKSIDSKKKTVLLSKGGKIFYDKLLIAIGAKPLVPPVKGIEQKGVFTLRSLDDAKKIEKYAVKRDKVLIVGGGLVGLRAGYALEQLGKRVTVVEFVPQILPQNLDKTAARIIEEFLSEKRWEIITGKSVAELKGNKKGVTTAVLSDGQEIETQMVVVGTGVRPDLSMAQSAGIETGAGIIVDNTMKVKIKGAKNNEIYSAGDVVQAHDLLLGKKAVNAIWPLARKQGWIAGLNMAGAAENYNGGFPMNSVDFYGLTVMSAGRADLPGIKFKTKKEDHVYRKIGIKDNKLVYYILVGNVDRAGMLTGLIKDKVDIGSFKNDLMSEDFGFLNMPKELRKEKITGKSA